MAVNCAEAGRELQCLLTQLPDANVWQDIERTAQSLANGLRIRDGPEDYHTALGKTSLPQDLTSLLKAALNGAPIPDEAHIGAVFEILRVSANLCMDHDENRGHLLEAALPQTIVSLLEGYADTIPSEPQSTPLPISIPHLKVVRTAVGVLLNCSVSFKPIRTRLTSLEAVVTMLKLSAAIYPPGSWVTATTSTLRETTEEDILESWTLRSGLSSWTWRTITELKDDLVQIFNPDILPLLISSLGAFTFPCSAPNSSYVFAQPSPLRTSLLQADFDCLEESCMFLEALSLDVEDARLSLARGLHFPAEHHGVLCIGAMLEFIERGTYPPLWYSDSGSVEMEVKRMEKSFDICKAAVIKAIVEVAGEEKNEDVLWDDSEVEMPGGEFVCRMVQWMKLYVTQPDRGPTGGETNGPTSNLQDRDDLIICATLSLGNLARREKNATTLLSPPHAIATLLTSELLLGSSTDIKLKHGVIGLLKNLAQGSAQSVDNTTALSGANVVRKLTSSKIWEQMNDPMAEVVQVRAIGVVKHLCNASVENTFALVLPDSSDDPSGLLQILALVQRSDAVPIKSEGTRVLVNVIKSLWSGDSASSHHEERQTKRLRAMSSVTTPGCAEALARLIGRSGKYPALVNEGVVALSLLSTQRDGAPLVLAAILAPLPLEAASPPPASAVTPISPTGETTSPIVTSPASRTALDMLVSVLKSCSSQMAGGSVVSPQRSDFPLEVGTNVCALLGQIGKNTSVAVITEVKEATAPILEELVKSTQGAQGREAMLGAAAKKASDIWATHDHS